MELIAVTGVGRNDAATAPRSQSHQRRLSAAECGRLRPDIDTNVALVEFGRAKYGTLERGNGSQMVQDEIAKDRAAWRNGCVS
jgi:hypothetical protein